MAFETEIRLRKEYMEQQFSHLNEMQREAVFSVKGPLLILAGAGSGKTSVLINRISNMVRFGDSYASSFFPLSADEETVRMLEEAVKEKTRLPLETEQRISVGRVMPYNILAITFTNKAAGELRERLSRSLGALSSQVMASTFHSLCVKILRRDGGNLGIASNFTIYDTDDQRRTMKEIYKDFGVDEKFVSVRNAISRMSSYKDRMISPEEAESMARNTMDKIVVKCYAEYNRRLRKAMALDFDDLIYETVRLLNDYEDVRDYYNNRYRYVMVDEYQDTSVAQFMLVRLLSQHGNICVVGDDDQSIYRFRGATIENILSFEDNFGGSKVIRLEQNYRSTRNILGAANSVIRNNRGRKGKTLWTAQSGGEKVKVFVFENEFDEARNVADIILDNQKNGVPFSAHAVLYRTNAQSANIENALARNGIAYRVIGGHRFYDRAEIKDILSYVNIVVNPEDSLRLRRIINTPPRKIGDTTVNNILALSEEKGVSMIEILYNMYEYPSLSRSITPLNNFLQIYKELQKAYRELPRDEFVSKVVEITGYADMLKARGKEGEERMDNIGQLVSNVKAYMDMNPGATMDMFLEEISLISDIDNYDEKSDSVTLMTLHSAKGLEFPYVFIVGMEEGLFPGEQSRYDPHEVEEERRLCYVGITRAKKELYMSRAKQRLLYGRTTRPEASRFLEELDEETYDEIDRSVKRKEYLFDDYEGASGGRVPSYNKGVSGFDALKPRKEREATRPSVIYLLGDRVRHRTFGDGTVTKVTRVANDSMLEIRFDDVGMKRVMANFAPIKKINE
ncbi:MAG: UvrD-helicase domain-containing protein [Oscillospiraceae bacterium]|nr:UvrD-helicase domain-containing protein [Oscillospiraceae bacterium]